MTAWRAVSHCLVSKAHEPLVLASDIDPVETVKTVHDGQVVEKKASYPKGDLEFSKSPTSERDLENSKSFIGKFQ